MLDYSIQNFTDKLDDEGNSDVDNEEDKDDDEEEDGEEEEK